MTAKKKQIADPEETDLLKTEHWSVKTVSGFSAVSRFSKTFYIPDDELVELHELLTTWRKEKENENG